MQTQQPRKLSSQRNSNQARRINYSTVYQGMRFTESQKNSRVPPIARFLSIASVPSSIPLRAPLLSFIYLFVFFKLLQTK